MKKQRTFIKIRTIAMIGVSLLFLHNHEIKANEMNLTGSPTHIGTFEGSTTFTTSSSNGVNPGLYLEVMDRYGNVAEYESEEGVITIPNTKEGAYVTQTKLLGKTKYVDQDTGEILDTWEEGRNLELVSVENPKLMTTGKNLLNERDFKEGIWILPIYENGKLTFTPADHTRSSAYFPVNLEKGKQYILSFNNITGDKSILQNDVNVHTDSDIDEILCVIKNKTPFTWDYETGTYYIRPFTNYISDKTVSLNIQLEEGAITTSYQPYKTNILTTSEEIELRGIDEVKDELNLLTGEYIQRVGEVVLDGDEKWDHDVAHSITGQLLRFATSIPDMIVRPYNTGKIVVSPGNFYIRNNDYANGNPSLPNIWDYYENNIYLEFAPSQLGVGVDDSYHSILEKLKTHLRAIPITVQYRFLNESVKAVNLNSTYTFGRVAIRDVYVDGDVKSLICSVNVPTESISFVLDPNQEEGNQFIAPTFSLINETPASIRVTLKSFEQETDVFNDVLPTKHSDWSQLDKEQSRDIALSLVPITSDGWVEIDETPRYVANHSSTVLGEIKAKSTVDLTFEALHGQAFIENLSPRYRLVFVFDF